MPTRSAETPILNIDAVREDKEVKLAMDRVDSHFLREGRMDNNYNKRVGYNKGFYVVLKCVKNDI
ncbi:hypothetical protein JCM12296A_03640 [Desulfosarcina cetonica]